ncbi:hypothetical protein BX257_9016 [Streptomyces sp. 3212.3]|jgi:hypothetical protein|uniref:hypothetical protein n=1 Tax=Streptomyces sp. 3212.3 TaxID=1938846 RepID=UPI000A3F0807|nr:hypothetical protein [Streptomyces sp. 3212.3]REE66199.1 hypothetical protein BX257_9016 [Streptomyces sp. 3212.3]
MPCGAGWRARPVCPTGRGPSSATSATLAGLRAEDGGDVLREISPHTDMKMRHIAELIV